MGWLSTLLRANWFPYVAIGFSVVVAAASGWGYMKGYSSAEKKFQGVVNKALKVQMKENQALAKKDLSTLDKSLKREQEVEKAIDDVVLPEISPDCTASFAEWMQSFNDAVRATNGDTRPAD